MVGGNSKVWGITSDWLRRVVAQIPEVVAPLHRRLAPASDTRASAWSGKPRTSSVRDSSQRQNTPGSIPVSHTRGW